MAISAYSATPSANSSISGINLAEGCNASGINDALRQLMADLAAPVFGTGAASFGGTLGVAGIFTPQALVDISGAAAGQIKFPATQNASANANTLDDYEEGTWTPSLGGSATYTTQAGIYTKIGNTVYFKFIITVNAIGTGSQSIISGLPFTSSVLAPCAVFDNGLALSVYSIGAYVTGATIILTGRTAAQASCTDGIAALTSGSRIEVCGTYIV